jgi:hypothetical protein
MDFRIILRRCLFPLRAHIIGLVYIASFLHTIYFAHLHTSLPYTPTPTNLQTHLHPTYLPYPYIPTLHTYTTPTNLQNPTYLPYPYTPTLLLQPPHPTLHACPTITHQLQEQAVRWCGCVLPVMKYYLLRNLLAKLLHLIWLFFWDPPAEGRGIEFSRKSAILADCTTIIVPFVNPFNGNFCELGRARFAQNKMEFPSQDVSKIYSILLSAKFEPFLNLFRGRAWWMCGMNLRVFMTWLVL